MSNKTKLSLTIMSVTATFLASTLTACGNSKWHEVAGSTGDPVAEQQTTQTKAEDLKPGQTVTTAPTRVILKQDPDVEDEEDAVLDHNTEVEVVDTTPKGRKGSIKVVTTDTHKEGYVPPEYLETKGPTQRPEDKYFMIQNIATEKVRVYENCATKDHAGKCHHKLILETDMVAGEDTPDKSRRTILGSYVISSWFKFYEDNNSNFPAFYNKNSPKLPDSGAEIEDWMSPSLLPNGKGSIRGAFGWYTAKLTPDAEEQWTHGTFGWGEDEGRFIDIARKSRLDLRSRGCTRIENQAIAFVREIMVTQSKIYKVYAKESLKDKDLKRYANQKPAEWTWKLKADGKVLDEGVYTLDQTPNVANGNVYQVPETSLKGTFLIDEGRLADYAHPKEIRVGGYKNKNLSSLVTETK